MRDTDITVENSYPDYPLGHVDIQPMIEYDRCAYTM
jgi:hypothetical protein